LKQHPKNKTKQQAQSSGDKWATFTYVGKEAFYLTNVFRDADLRIAFRTPNSIQNLLKHKNPVPDKFSSSGVY
jgi:hypothetical protein